MTKFGSYTQDELLRRAVQHYKGKSWKKIGILMEVTNLNVKFVSIF